jgi:hypothetical protein
MKKFQVRKDAQIKAILASHYCGVDKWSQTYIGLPSEIKGKEKFADVFDISETDVVLYLKDHDWDGRVVKCVEKIPERSKENDIKYSFSYVISSSIAPPFFVGYLGELERGQWETWHFSGKEEARIFVVKKLFEDQRQFWA